MSLIAIGHLLKLRLHPDNVSHTRPPILERVNRIRQSVLCTIKSLLPAPTREVQSLVSVIAADPADRSYRQLITNREFVRSAGVAYETLYNCYCSRPGIDKNNAENPFFDMMKIHLMSFSDDSLPKQTENTVLSLFVTVHLGERQTGVLLHYKEIDCQEADFDFFPICYNPAKLSEVRKNRILGEMLKNIAEIVSVTEARWKKPDVNKLEKARVSINTLEKRFYRSSSPLVTSAFDEATRDDLMGNSEFETSLVAGKLWRARPGASTLSYRSSQPQSPRPFHPISPTGVRIDHRELAKCSVCNSAITSDVAEKCKCVCGICWERYLLTYCALPEEILCPSCTQRISTARVAQRLGVRTAACGRGPHMARPSNLHRIQCGNSCMICTPCFISLFHSLPPDSQPIAITPCPVCADGAAPARI